MPTEIPSRDDVTLTAMRQRSLSYLGFLFWVALLLCLLWTCNALASLVEHWVVMLHGVRQAAGFAAPTAGPDYWIICGVSLLALAGVVALASAYAAYLAAWRRRLRVTWQTLGQAPPETAHLRIRPLRALASEAEIRQRTAYVHALTALPEWRSASPQQAPRQSLDSRQWCENAAAAMLRHIEIDIAHRAVTAGLVIGLNRNPMIDTLAILASAFELQLHVLTRLGKRPSLHTWIELLKRTSASVFLNSYVSREDALYLNLAIRKAALGLEMASDSVQELAGHMVDIDWDDVLGGMSVPGLSAVTSVAAMSMSVGSFGLRQLGVFIETTSHDLLQGVLAGGILYYHGMALAADCLALDEQHRRSPEMTRSIGQAMSIACNPAGRLLRDQVRRMREFLRERRRQAFGAAKNAAKERVDKIRTASTSKWDSLKDAAGFFRESQ